MKRKNLSKKRSGFTLPEILLVFALIGIITSIIIPSIARNVNTEKNKILWRKTYARIDQATIGLLANNSGGDFVGFFQNQTILTDKYATQLNYVKKCNGTAGCWHTSNNWSGLNGTPFGWTYGDGFVLGNGGLLVTSFDSVNCNTTNSSILSCGFMYVDVNGWAIPNVMGKDIFGVFITKDGILPMGTQGGYYEGSCISTSHGRGCSADYLYQ